MQKYVFILTFHVDTGDGRYAYTEIMIRSNNKELCYSEVEGAKRYVTNDLKENYGSNVKGLGLMNCTRTLNDNI